MLSKLHGNKGFTLVELMIVVVIIGILAALAIPRFMSSTVKAKQSEAKQLLKQIFTLESAYRQEANTFTASAADIGFVLPGNSKYLVSISSANSTFFGCWASAATQLDQDAAVDVWYIDTSGVITCITDDASVS